MRVGQIRRFRGTISIQIMHVCSPGFDKAPVRVVRAFLALVTPLTVAVIDAHKEVHGGLTRE
jgi:hypothetical protein